MKFIGNLQKSLTDINSNLGKGLMITVFDALFIMTTAFIFSNLFRSIWEPLFKLLAFFTNRSEPSPELQQFIADIGSSQDVFALINTVIGKATIFFFILMIIWTIFQTIVWHISYTIAKQPEEHLPLRKFGLRMLGVNIIFFPIIYLVISTTLRLSYGTRVQSALIAGGFTFLLSQQIIFWSGTILLCTIIITMHICYPFIMEHTLKQTAKHFFKLIKKRFVHVFLAFLIIAGGFYVSHSIQAPLAPINLTIMFLFGFLLDFGLLVLLRVLLINVVLPKKRQEQHQKLNLAPSR